MWAALAVLGLVAACADRKAAASDRCWSTSLLRAKIGGVEFDFPATISPFPSPVHRTGLISMLQLDLGSVRSPALSYCQDRGHVPIELDGVQIKPVIAFKRPQPPVTVFAASVQEIRPNNDAASFFIGNEREKPAVSGFDRDSRRRGAVTVGYGQKEIRCTTAEIFDRFGKILHCQADVLVGKNIYSTVSFECPISSLEMIPSTLGEVAQNIEVYRR